MYIGKSSLAGQLRIDDNMQPHVDPDMQPRIDDKSSQMKSWVCIFLQKQSFGGAF